MRATKEKTRRCARWVFLNRLSLLDEFRNWLDSEEGEKLHKELITVT